MKRGFSGGFGKLSGTDLGSTDVEGVARTGAVDEP